MNKGYVAPMKAILTKTRGIELMVDDADYDLCSPYNWSIDKYGYAISWQLRQLHECVFIHRWIMKPEKGMVIDHINGNKLDNRRENLRICTKGQNICNADTHKNVRQGKWKGYSFNRGKFAARIKIKGNVLYLGRHATEEEAALAYNNAAIKHFGAFACLNKI